jgi:hypothetical protein
LTSQPAGQGGANGLGGGFKSEGGTGSDSGQCGQGYLGGHYISPGGFGGGSFSGGGGGEGEGEGEGNIAGAGGGGSYIAPAFTNTFGTDGANSGNGFVSIDPAGAVPEASTWAMMLAGFTGLGALALRKKKTTLA